MRDIIEDFKNIMIILLGSAIYSFILCDKVDLIEIVNMLLIVIFAISMCTIIISYKYDKKYLNNLYRYLSISFFGLGIVSVSYIYIVKMGAYKIGFWNNAANFNVAFSFFESLIILFCFINRNKTIKFEKFFMAVILLSSITVYIGIHYEKGITLLFNSKIYEYTKNYPLIFATILKIYVLYFVYSIKEKIPQKLNMNFFIFLCSRILLHILGIVNFNYNTKVTLVLSCLILLIGNYSMAKIMVIDIIKIPQDSLYKDLSEKTKNLQDTVLKMKEISDEKDIMYNNYNKREKEEQLRNNILINLSHEFKTPINVIYSAIQTQDLMKRNGNVLGSIKYIDVIKQNCNRLIRLVNNFIDVTHLENGILKTNFKYINLVEVTENIIMNVNKFIKTKNVNIIFDTDEEEVYAYVDKVLYRRTILNILSNSIKYTNIESDIVVKIENEGEYVSIIISDRGIGIEEDKLLSIFNRFERVDKTFSRDTEGTGLGLNLVKEIIKLFNGKLRIRSEKGVGTTINLKIPKSNLPKSEKEKVIKEVDDEDNVKHEVEVEMSDIYFD